MPSLYGRLGLALLIILSACGSRLLASDGVTAHAAALARIRFTTLDAGKAVVPHVLVTAMAFGPGGTIYAGGRYMARDTNPMALQPVAAAGSVWLVSHDHGGYWSQRISTTSLVVLRRNSVRDTWTDHTYWPIDFTANSITVDPTNPHVIYVAGCTGGNPTCVMGSVTGRHMLLRSTDGGRSWHDALSYRPSSGAVVPLQAYSVAVDPHNGRRVYACTAGPGMLFSDDGARTWHVGVQPGRESVPCEVLIDPRSSRVIYSLDRHGKVYRSTDAGMHWMLRSAFGYISGQMLTSLTILGGTLYVTANKGLSASTDGGTHWRLVKPEPIADGSMLQSIRGAGGWITAVANRQGTPPEGLYVARDGQRWQVAAFTDLHGPKYFGALDLAAYGDSATRMWDDHTARIVFTAGGLGGLYRWSSGL